jgi:hypothetical protein
METNNMNTKLSEMDFYMKSDNFANGKVDNSGPETRVIIEEMIGLPADEIHYVGYSEADFDFEHVNFLSEICYYMDAERLDIKQRTVKEDDLELVQELFQTKYGNICVVSAMADHDTSTLFFTDEATKNTLEVAIKNFKSGLTDEPTEPFKLTLKNLGTGKPVFFNRFQAIIASLRQFLAIFNPIFFYFLVVLF